MARILIAMLLVCGWAWGCEGSDDGGKDVPQTIDPGPGGDVATDVPPADDVPVQDPAGGAASQGRARGGLGPGGRTASATMMRSGRSSGSCQGGSSCAWLCRNRKSTSS